MRTALEVLRAISCASVFLYGLTGGWDVQAQETLTDQAVLDRLSNASFTHRSRPPPFSGSAFSSQQFPIVVGQVAFVPTIRLERRELYAWPVHAYGDVESTELRFRAFMPDQPRTEVFGTLLMRRFVHKKGQLEEQNNGLDWLPAHLNEEKAMIGWRVAF